MRETNPIKLASLKSAPPNASANVYDIGLKEDERIRLRRVRALKDENALLIRLVSETQMEIARLRDLLSSS